nr:MAG TPA: hypothetical protein [Bacteriophage sp.]
MRTRTSPRQAFPAWGHLSFMTKIILSVHCL